MERIKPRELTKDERALQLVLRLALSSRMRERLIDLLDTEVWDPDDDHSWPTARALARRGFVHQTSRYGKHTGIFKITTKGRLAALVLQGVDPSSFDFAEHLG